MSHADDPESEALVEGLACSDSRRSFFAGQSNRGHETFTCLWSTHARNRAV
jgi:hypothetical protein